MPGAYACCLVPRISLIVLFTAAFGLFAQDMTQLQTQKAQQAQIAQQQAQMAQQQAQMANQQAQQAATQASQ